MKKLIGFALVLALAASAAVANGTAAGSKRSDTTLNGAGSSFVSPLVAQWATATGSALGITLNYSPIGSGGGIAAITNRTVDFGASDAPLSPDQVSACKGCVQIPWALSATAVIYNVAGARDLLHMDGATLADIYAGKITKWNDPRIGKLNRGVSLPAENIAVVHRSDNSGTTFNFTDYLASVSPSWKSRYGTGVAVSWPTGTGARGSSGVAAAVSQTNGGIGYVDVAFALRNHLKFFAMKNQDGKYTTPGLRGILSAASSDQKPDATNALSIVNPPKKFANAYPISTYTYVIVPVQSAKAADLKKFLFWAVKPTAGQKFGPRLLFAPLPTSVLVVAEKTIAKLHT